MWNQGWEALIQFVLYTLSTYSKWGPQTSCINITWVCVRNVESQAPELLYWSLQLKKYSQGSHTHIKLEKVAVQSELRSR